MANDTHEAIPVCPAPWSLTGQGWIVPLYTPFSQEPIPLPEGSYAPLERGSAADLSGRFHGGVGAVLIVRYETSDVGPYDELMYIPGLFSLPKTKSGDDSEMNYALAITRIYVSSDASVANGRRNWSIPKQRADFNFKSSLSGFTNLSVSHPSASPSAASSCFFRCTLQPMRLVPLAIPVRTSWLSTKLARACMSGYAPVLVQPALPGATKGDDQGTAQRTDALVASEAAWSVEPKATGWARAITIVPFPQEATDGETDQKDWSGFGDGKGFPRFKPYGKRLNVHVQGLKMEFPIPCAVPI